MKRGRVSGHPRGFAFIDVEGEEEEIFIPRGQLGGAIDGDLVDVEVTGEREKGPVGRVVAVIERGRTCLAGTVLFCDKKGRARLYCPLLGLDGEVFVTGKELKVGDRIIAKITQWQEEGQGAEGTVERILGHIDDPSIDVIAACAEFEVSPEFPKNALKEADSLGDAVLPKDLENRCDLRDIPTVTIDPISAKDYDDALSLKKSSDGHLHLMVHVADVSYYVTRSSALDKSAKKRCNSTYFPGICVPMLPPSLSDNLCSLQPLVDRLAVTVEMEFDLAGELLNYSIYRSAIRSDKRFSYEEAKEVLDGKRDSPFKPLLEEMVELCLLLKKQRRKRGSVEFILPELSVEVNAQGVPVKTHLIEYDITHQLVEEFALKANEMVATHLTKLQRGLTYRVHDMPSDEDLAGFFQLARFLGYPLPKKPSLLDLQLLFDKANKTPHGTYLAISFIRSQKLAAYSPDNIGHYGLSLEHYCHFTSPIRRYADLLVHRVLLEAKYSEKEVEKIARACSEKERISAKAEGSVLRLKKLRLLKAAPYSKNWKALITQVKSAGVVFEVVDLMLEGFLHVSELGDDFYEFDETGRSFKGRHTGQRFAFS
ncbi:MAG: VacB/RNase II family 3'-5' exoribonuclease, partial [Verrucomicrobia bacterium]|nr:VacB/RNase II family 3'-5' exoribonuclease [Verrucomicrobiota bacterium]